MVLTWLQEWGYCCTVYLGCWFALGVFGPSAGKLLVYEIAALPFGRLAMTRGVLSYGLLGVVLHLWGVCGTLGGLFLIELRVLRFEFIVE